MQKSFHASFLKIARAKQHLQELEKVVADFLASDPAKFAPAPQVPGMISFGGMTLRGLPEITSAILGDIIHNLRASLDLMAVALCQSNGHSGEKVYFPFCEKADDLPRTIKQRNFDSAGPKAVQLLTELRPYKGGNAVLRAIHDLDIQDKHRSLIPSMMNVESPVFRMDVIDGKLTPVPVGDHTKPSAIKLSMPAGGVFADQELIPCLRRLIDTTESIISTFEQRCAAPG
ncbi:MAG TPA: hypothetical protein VG889_03390 [Rhizomicrobium sp.]|nr:hypothetical protein [Rhizomicrobium sp.]